MLFEKGGHNRRVSVPRGKWLPVVENLSWVVENLTHLIKSTLLKEIAAIIYY